LTLFPSVNSAEKGIVILSQLFRASVVSLTYYAVYIAKSAIEGNVVFNFFGGLIPFLLIASIALLGINLFIVHSFQGKERLGFLLFLAILVAVDFINDIAWVLLGIQILPV
jgi:hypothetical protein